MTNKRYPRVWDAPRAFRDVKGFVVPPDLSTRDGKKASSLPSSSCSCRCSSIGPFMLSSISSVIVLCPLSIASPLGVDHTGYVPYGLRGKQGCIVRFSSGESALNARQTRKTRSRVVPGPSPLQRKALLAVETPSPLRNNDEEARAPVPPTGTPSS